MHPEVAALLIVGDGLDHRAEDVGVNLGPVEVADVDKIGARDFGEARHLIAPREEPAVHVGELVRPARDLCRFALFMFGVHSAEERADDLVGIRCIRCAHAGDGFGEAAFADEDVGVFGKEAEDEPRHELIHIAAAFGFAPVGVVFEKLDVEAIQADGRPDIDGVLADLANRADAREGEEEAKVIGEFFVRASDGLSAREIFGLKNDAVCREDEARLRGHCRRAHAKRRERFGDSPRLCDEDMDMVPLKDAAEIGAVRRARAETLDGRGLIAKGLKEGVGELGRVKRL